MEKTYRFGVGTAKRYVSEVLITHFYQNLKVILIKVNEKIPYH